jgi:hypothetical protein
VAGQRCQPRGERASALGSGPRRFAAEGASGLRFAFYGRMSTLDFQDQVSSCRWQRDCAAELVAGHGRVVVEFFDAGVSRRAHCRRWWS